MQLSTNFWLSEFTASETAEAQGIDNTPNYTEKLKLALLCQDILQPARDNFGQLNVTSGFRGKALNKAVGGADDSQHRLAEAGDVIPEYVSCKELTQWIRDNTDFDQVIWEKRSDGVEWVHVSYKPLRENRGEVLTAIVDSGGNARYFKGVVQ